jgi:hypothetical protein
MWKLKTEIYLRSCADFQEISVTQQIIVSIFAAQFYANRTKYLEETNKISFTTLSKV